MFFDQMLIKPWKVKVIFYLQHNAQNYCKNSNYKCNLGIRSLLDTLVKLDDKNAFFIEKGLESKH